MLSGWRRSPQRFWVPEVVQTSAMDCGPAALASILQGQGMAVSYPRLRELCQTDVDGTSVDTMEELALQLGADAEQVVLPSDWLFAPAQQVLPAIVVSRLPNGLTHFIVLWQVLGSWVQIMDPASGRRWIRRQQLMDQLYQHAVDVAAQDWLDYARGDEFRLTLEWQLQRLVSTEHVIPLIQQAYAAADWQSLSDLDAFVRLLKQLADEGWKRRQLDEIVAAYRHDADSVREFLTDELRQARSIPTTDEVSLNGVVVLKVKVGHEDPERPAVGQNAGGQYASVMQADVAWWQQLLSLAEVRESIPLLRGLVLGALLVGMLTLIEGLVFRYLISVQPSNDPWGLLPLAAVVLVPMLALLLLERGSYAAALNVGRSWDGSLRAMLLRRLPKIRDSYFASRLISDLCERSHNVTELQQLPDLLRRIALNLARLLFVAVGLIWIVPQLWWVTLLATVAIGVLPWLLVSWSMEQDLRTRAHLSALGRIHLDGLRGAEVIWSHGAHRTVALEHDQLLARWCAAGLQLARSKVAIDLFLLPATYVAAMVLIAYLVIQQDSLGLILLCAFWAMNLPLIAGELTDLAQQLPRACNVVSRVLELFSTQELEPPQAEAMYKNPVGFEFRQAAVVRAQQPVLHNLNAAVTAGEQIAVVGASGSGKSSLIGTLMGFHPISHGALLINDEPVSMAQLQSLRERTLLIDAELYLWNRPLLENLLQGVSQQQVDANAVDAVLQASGLREDLTRMPLGLSTMVGENGKRLSGGEGQRLRLARGMLVKDPSLVLLDEPFRGLSERQRRQMLETLRVWFPRATLVFVSHDVAHTMQFERVWVMSGGTLVEDDHPHRLAAAGDSLFARMLADEQSLTDQLTQGWQTLSLKAGHIQIDGHE